MYITHTQRTWWDMCLLHRRPAIGTSKSPLCRRHFQMHFLCKNYRNLIQISRIFYSVAIKTEPTFILIMAWCWTGDKPSSWPIMVRFTDAYLCHSFSMSSYKTNACRKTNTISVHFVKCLWTLLTMVLLPDTYNCGLCMHRGYRERFPATVFKGNG